MQTDEIQSDHDILVEVRTIQKFMVQDVKEIKDGMSLRIAIVEKDKADKKDLEVIIKQMESLKEFHNRTIGALLILQVVFGVMVSWYVSHH